jgi:hypothetical protein
MNGLLPGLLPSPLTSMQEFPCIKKYEMVITDALVRPDSAWSGIVQEVDAFTYSRYQLMRGQDIPVAWCIDWTLGLLCDALEDSLMHETLFSYWSLRLLEHAPSFHARFGGHQEPTCLADYQFLTHLGELLSLEQQVLNLHLEGKELKRTQKHLLSRLDTAIKMMCRHDEKLFMRDISWLQMAAHAFITHGEWQHQLLDDDYVYAHAQLVAESAGQEICKTPLLVMDFAVLDAIDGTPGDFEHNDGLYSRLLEAIVINTRHLQYIEKAKREHTWDCLLTHELIHGYQEVREEGDEVRQVLCEGATELLALLLTDTPLIPARYEGTHYFTYIAFVKAIATKVGQSELDVARELAFTYTDRERLETASALLDIAPDRLTEAIEKYLQGSIMTSTAKLPARALMFLYR